MRRRKHVTGFDAGDQTRAEAALADIILYGTEFCSLCDRARGMITPVCHRLGLSIAEIDVADDPALESRYAESVPVVLRTDTARELAWPFETADLYRFLL